MGRTDVETQLQPGSRLVRGTGWLLVVLSVVSLIAALGTAALLLAGHIAASESPWLVALADVHALMWPPVSAGLVGVGLVHLARGPVGRVPGGAVTTGVAIAIVGAAGALRGWPGWPGADPSGVPFLWGHAVASVGWTLGAMGVLGVLAQRRAWPVAWDGLLLAAVVRTLATAPLDAFSSASSAVSMAGWADRLWVNLHPFGPGTVLPWMFGAAIVVATAAAGARRPGVERVLTVAWLGVVAVDLVAYWSSGVSRASAVALSIGVVVGAGYLVDSIRARTLRWRAAQPIAAAAVLLWALSEVGGLTLQASESQLFLHDTLAEVSVVHLGPVLLSALVLAGVARLDPSPVDWRAWIGFALGALLLGAGAVYTSGVLFSLGVEGVPRRYPHIGEWEAWLPMVRGALLCAAGVSGLGLGLTVRLVVRWGTPVSGTGGT